jgi:hypothetical protein
MNLLRTGTSINRPLIHVHRTFVQCISNRGIYFSLSTIIDAWTFAQYMQTGHLRIYFSTPVMTFLSHFPGIRVLVGSDEAIYTIGKKTLHGRECETGILCTSILSFRKYGIDVAVKSIFLQCTVCLRKKPTRRHVGPTKVEKKVFKWHVSTPKDYVNCGRGVPM